MFDENIQKLQIIKIAPRRYANGPKLLILLAKWPKLSGSWQVFVWIKCAEKNHDCYAMQCHAIVAIVTKRIGRKGSKSCKVACMYTTHIV